MTYTSVVAGEYKQSYELYEQALRVEPHSASLHYNLGNTLMDLAIQSDVSLLRRSVTHYVECLSAEATYPGAMNNLGNALKEMDLLVPALRAWQTAQRLHQGQRHPDVFANMVHLRMFVCDWDDWAWRYRTLVEILSRQVAAESEAVGAGGGGAGALNKTSVNKTSVSCQPFHALLYAELPPPLVLAIARAFARQVQDSTRHYIPHHPASAPPPLPAAAAAAAAARAGGGGRARVRVGYLSHDLGDHPTGHLFNSVPALHVRGGGVEAVYFTLKGPEPSRYWRRLERDAGAGNGGVVYRVRIEDRGTEVS